MSIIHTAILSGLIVSGGVSGRGLALKSNLKPNPKPNRKAVPKRLKVKAARKQNCIRRKKKRAV